MTEHVGQHHQRRRIGVGGSGCVIRQAHQTQVAIARQTESLGFDTNAVAALARAAGSRAREVPQELTERLVDSGLTAEAVMVQAHSEGLNIALSNVGYLLLALISTALVLSLRLAKSTPQTADGGLSSDVTQSQ